MPVRHAHLSLAFVRA